MVDLKDDRNSQDAGTTPAPVLGRSVRLGIAIAVSGVVLLYLGLVFRHQIAAEDRLNVAELVLLFVTAVWITGLVNPALIDRIARLKFRGFEIELLDRIRKDQKEQRAELDDVRFVLSLLLKNEELQHLRNLQSADTKGYVGSRFLRSELGKLLDLRLIEKLPNRHLGEYRDGARIDLAVIARLTSKGAEFLSKLPDFKPEEPAK